MLHKGDAAVPVAHDDDALVDARLVLQDPVLGEDEEVEVANREVEVVPLLAVDLLGQVLLAVHLVPLMIPLL